MIADIITEVFSTASSVVSGLATLFGDLIGTMYTADALTDFGTLVILVAAVPLAWNVLSYIVGLFKAGAKVKGR